MAAGRTPPSTRLEVRLRDASGAWVPVRVSTATVLAADGSVAHLVVLVEDHSAGEHSTGEQLRAGTTP